VFTPGGVLVNGVTIGGLGSVDGKFKFPSAQSNPDGVAGGIAFGSKGQLFVAGMISLFRFPMFCLSFFFISLLLSLSLSLSLSLFGLLQTHDFDR
jgi:hypothetical protein